MWFTRGLNNFSIKVIVSINYYFNDVAYPQSRFILGV